MRYNFCCKLYCNGTCALLQVVEDYFVIAAQADLLLYLTQTIYTIFMVIRAMTEYTLTVKFHLFKIINSIYLRNTPLHKKTNTVNV